MLLSYNLPVILYSHHIVRLVHTYTEHSKPPPPTSIISIIYLTPRLPIFFFLLFSFHFFLFALPILNDNSCVVRLSFVFILLKEEKKNIFLLAYLCTYIRHHTIPHFIFIHIHIPIPSTITITIMSSHKYPSSKCL